MSKGQFMDIVKDKETMKGIYTVKMTSHHLIKTETQWVICPLLSDFTEC